MLKKDNKISITLILYLILSIVYLRLGKDTPLWDSFFFMLDKGCILALLIFLYNRSWSSFQKIIYIAGSIYAVILLVFNLIIASKTPIEHDLLVTSFKWSNILALLVSGILILLWIFKKFVK